MPQEDADRDTSTNAIVGVAVAALVVLLVAMFIPALDVHVQAADPYWFSVAFIEMTEYGSSMYLVVALLTTGALALMWKKGSGWTTKIG